GLVNREGRPPCRKRRSRNASPSRGRPALRRLLEYIAETTRRFAAQLADSSCEIRLHAHQPLPPLFGWFVFGRCCENAENGSTPCARIDAHSPQGVSTESLAVESK